jgi:hypothetical protein
LETLSPGTADPVCALGSSVVISSREAQAEIKNAIAKNKAPKIASRFITRVKTNHDSAISQIASVAWHGNRRTRLSSFDVTSVDW